MCNCITLKYKSPSVNQADNLCVLSVFCISKANVWRTGLCNKKKKRRCSRCKTRSAIVWLILCSSSEGGCA